MLDNEPAPLPPVKRRTTELTLLGLALGISLAAYAAAGFALNGALPGGMFGYGLSFCGMTLGVHVLMRFIAPYADPIILPCAVLLNGLGLAMVWRLNAGGSGDHAGVGSQLIWSAVGMVLCLGILFFFKQARTLQRYPYLIALLSIILLALPMVPGLGIEVFGARRWIGIGGFTMQPSEFAKIGVVLFLSGYLVQKRSGLSSVNKKLRIGPVKLLDLPRVRDMGPMTVGVAMAILLLVGTTDLGTSLMLFGTFLAMIYVATQRSSWIIIGLAAFMAAATVAWLLFSHVQLRVNIWLNAFDPELRMGDSHQLVSGIYAFAEGGLLGTGLGEGSPDTIFAADSDFIMVSFGEELGLTGLMAIVVVIFLLVQRGLRVALASRELFVKMVASGLSFLLAFQVFVVLGGVTRVIPLTGMTTPFMSAGGTSLMASWVIIGILLRLSDNARAPAPVAIQDEGATQVISR